MGGMQGSFTDLTAVDLGGVAISEAVARAKLSGDDVQEVIMSCVLPNGLRQDPAR